MAKKKNCPNCAESIETDAILCRFCESGLSSEHFQPCSQCDEMIRKNAVVCRYCKSTVVQEKVDRDIEQIDRQPGEEILLHPWEIPVAPEHHPTSLPLQAMAPSSFLPFLRHIETQLLERTEKPIVLYVSQQSTTALIPKGPKFQELMSKTSLFTFSADLQDTTDFWLAVFLSADLCLTLSGQLLDDPDGYLCCGSMDPSMVDRSLEHLMPRLRYLDASEAERLEGAIENLGPPRRSSPELVKRIREEWLVEVEEAFRRGPDLVRIMQPVPSPLSILSEEKQGEAPEAIPVAERIVCNVTRMLCQQRDLESIVQETVEVLTDVLEANRGIIWRVKGDHLRVTNEFATSGHNCFLHSRLTPQESTSAVLEILSRFPDESGEGVILVQDTSQDHTLANQSSTMAALMELGGVKSRLIGQLRTRGVFDGFVEIQKCEGTAEWSKADALILQRVANAISCIVRMVNDQSTIDCRIDDITLVNQVAGLFVNSPDTGDSIARVIELLAEKTGFEKSQIYLLDPEKKALEGQLDNGDLAAVLSLSKSKKIVRKSAILSAYHSLQHKLVNAELCTKDDPDFGHQTAVVLPLISFCERLGVLVLYARKPGMPGLTPLDCTHLQSVSSILAQALYIDKLKQ